MLGALRGPGLCRCGESLLHFLSGADVILPSWRCAHAVQDLVLEGAASLPFSLTWTALLLWGTASDVGLLLEQLLLALIRELLTLAHYRAA